MPKMDVVTNTQARSSAPIDFFSRNHLPSTARSQCWRFAQSLHPSSQVLEPACQGHCSYTLLLLLPDRKTIIQFRPPKHRLDLEIASAAHETFGALAPHTQLLSVITFATTRSPEHDTTTDTNKNDSPSSLIVYSHSFIEGTPLPNVLLPSSSSSSSCPNPPPRRWLNLEPLLRTLAKSYFARSYTSSSLLLPPATSSTHLPLQPQPRQRRRRIGQTLRHRLALLHTHLPARFRPVVEEVASALGEVESGLPWTLTHGDLCGAGVGNLLVHLHLESSRSYSQSQSHVWEQQPVVCNSGIVEKGVVVGGVGGGITTTTTGEVDEVRLAGMIDWAEGEYLPFGVGLYGVEEVLGRMVVDVPAIKGEKKRRRFEYHPHAGRLREVFWEELEAAVPALVEDKELRKRVEKARLLGLLLWYVTLYAV
jgi:hypothetical protein